MRKLLKFRLEQHDLNQLETKPMNHRQNVMAESRTIK